MSVTPQDDGLSPVRSAPPTLVSSSQDLPDGNYRDLKRKGVQPKNNLGREFAVAVRYCLFSAKTTNILSSPIRYD